MRHHLAAIEPLGMKPVKAHAPPRARQACQKRRVAGEQLQVHHGIDLCLARPSEEAQRVHSQRQQAGVANGHDVRFGNRVQQPRALCIALEDEEENLRAQSPLGLGNGRVRDHRAAHLGELHKKDTLRLLGTSGPSQQAHQLRAQETQRHADPVIDGPHRLQLHSANPLPHSVRCCPFLKGAHRTSGVHPNRKKRVDSL